ncbi:DUF3617 domain-containing protein [Sphingomonas aracearum]|uniref:DUF3617 family protein n=1 Tax=Sphingomonas aracearum TaxID=2283317 RepID=A0A369VW02_9SPHN|nr:hypothetical protein [Sphingomonas aracearum]RDE05757.1 hypothetical protein DVW87_11180 [Sphingomonas aracearum]
MRQVVRLGTLALALAGVTAAAPRMAALAGIERGQWQLREAGGAVQTVCVADPALLLQPAHRGAGCSRFVVEDAPASLVVHYTCPGAGHGRTELTVETSRLVHIQTSGIAAGQPFEFDYEARRTGTCAPPR